MSLADYEVVGPRAIAGVAPGGTVSLDSDQYHIPGLIEAGHILPAKPKRKKTAPDAPAAPDGDVNDG